MSPVQNAFLGQRLYHAGDYAAAVAQLQNAIAMTPDFSFAHGILGRVLVMRQQYAEAITELELARRLDRGVPTGDLGHAYALAGDRAAAESVLAELLAHAQRKEPSDPYQIALVYLGLGQRDRALDSFTKAYEDRESADMAIDPRLDVIAGDPRFVAMLQKSGLRFTPGKPR